MGIDRDGRGLPKETRCGSMIEKLPSNDNAERAVIGACLLSGILR